MKKKYRNLGRVDTKNKTLYIESKVVGRATLQKIRKLAEMGEVREVTAKESFISDNLFPEMAELTKLGVKFHLSATHYRKLLREVETDGLLAEESNMECYVNWLKAEITEQCKVGNSLTMIKDGKRGKDIIFIEEVLSPDRVRVKRLMPHLTQPIELFKALKNNKKWWLLEEIRYSDILAREYLVRFKGTKEEVAIITVLEDVLNGEVTFD